MHCLISGVSTLKTFSCLCSSFTIVFFHMIVSLPAVFCLKPRRGESTQPGDNSHPQGTGWHLSPSQTLGIQWEFPSVKLFAAADPRFLSWLLWDRWPAVRDGMKSSSLDLAGNKGGFLPAVPCFLTIARSCSSNNFSYVVLAAWL